MNDVALIVVGLIAVAGMGSLMWVVHRLVGTIKAMGDQLTANSGHQLERIKFETGAEAVRGYVSAIRPQNNGYAPNEPMPDAFIPERGMPDRG